MTPQLPEEWRQALANHSEQPVRVEDPVTHAQYVLLRLDVHEQMQRAMDYDTSDPDPRAFYPTFAEAVKDDLDAPGMEEYDRETPSRDQP